MGQALSSYVTVPVFAPANTGIAIDAACPARGRRHHGAYDIDHLSRAVRAAGARASLAASQG